MNQRIVLGMGRVGIATLLVALFAPCAGAQQSGMGSSVASAAVESIVPQRDDLRPSGPSLTSSTSSIAKIVSLNYHLGERRSVGVSTELIKVASFYFRYGPFEETPDWKFKAVPITLKYEQVLADPSRTIVPVAGIGVSYYLSQLKMRDSTPAGAGDSGLGSEASVTRVLGMGWGAQATCGIRTRLSSSAFLELQGRYRLVNGLDIMGPESSQARFGVFDFVVGVGFNL